MEIKIPYGKTFQTLNIEEGFELLESKIQELEAGADGGANFYGYDGIDQISLRATYKLKLGRFDMPVFAHAMWNPDQRAGYLQVGVNLFAF